MANKPISKPKDTIQDISKLINKKLLESESRRIYGEKLEDYKIVLKRLKNKLNRKRSVS